jgi:protein-disulfide isomerase
MNKFIVIGLAMLCGQVMAASNNSLLPDESSVVGKVNGTQITLGEIQNKKIHDLRSDLHKELENAFISEAIRRLRDSDKAFGKISVPALKDEEIRKFYDDNNLSMRGSYEQFEPQIRQYLTQMLTAREEYKLYKAAGDKGQASNNLVGPGPFLVTVPVETAFIQGAKKGSVMLLEFSDFQCPYCKKVQPALQKLVKKYSDKVAFGYRHYPLAFHQEADESAIAAECAREQGKFMEMHAILYRQQKSLSIENLQLMAKKIGVKDLKKFNACLKGDKYRKQLARDMEVAESVGINGTPAFIIGKFDSEKGIIRGEILTGAQPIDVIEQALNRYLSK